MIMDSKHYRSRKDAIVKLVNAYTGGEMKRRLAEISIATGVPIIVVYTFYVEEFGGNEEALRYMERIMEFYGYDAVT